MKVRSVQPLRLLPLPLLLLLSGAGGCGLFAEPEPLPVYTEEQVVENVVTYLQVLLGDEPPTIRDYFAAEGPGPGMERQLELASCSRELGVSVESQRVRAAPACTDWVSERRRNADTVPSLYYEAVRALTQADPDQLRIDLIAPPDQSDAYWRILATETASNTRLDLYHAARPDLASVSRVGVLRVNGELVTELLGPRLEGWAR